MKRLLPRILRDHRIPRNLRIFYGAIFLSFVLAALFMVYILILSFDLPSVENFESRRVQQSTKIYDREGKTLLYEISAGQKRTIIPFGDIPEYLKQATIAIEDENFYNEPAFDLKAILRSLYVNVTNRQVVQGASTITQQLAKNAFLSSERTFTRKMKELILAVRLNSSYTKDQVLYFYLNEIPYGPVFYGVESASQAYFGKPAKELDLAQSAILAAIPQAPTYYYPWGNNGAELKRRQELVLKRMFDLGFISATQYSAARSEEIVFEPQNLGIRAPHFVMAVQNYLIKKYGEDMVRTGGLSVQTTLDWELQELAEKTVLEGAKRNAELYGGKNAALVAQDPKTGQVLAMVGSRDYFDKEIDGNFNVATQGLRQPGSALKPFVYMRAFEKGYSPDTVLFDVPTEFVPGCPPLVLSDARECFNPSNYDGKFRGPVQMKVALGNSLNIPAVKTLYLVGISDALETLRRLGIRTLNDPSRLGLSLVLGGGEVYLLDMVEAYAVLAEEGLRHEQSLILEVKDNKGEVLEKFSDRTEEVISPEYPRLINDILSNNENRYQVFGTFLPESLADNQVAIKTGTSNDFKDAWAFGYSRNLVAGVWAGNNDNKPMNQLAASVAVPIWRNFMSEALKKFPASAFTRPESIFREKAYLAGKFNENGEVHSILYYVNKNDPLGPAPLSPEVDPQFSNWEAAVQNWVRNFRPDLLVPGEGGEAPRIEISSPRGGDYLTGTTISVSSRITSPSAIAGIRAYLNGSKIREFSGNFGNDYYYSDSIVVDPAHIQTQNLFELEVWNEKGMSNRYGVVLYR